MAFSYPLLLDVAGRLIVIVGGGAVAARKARVLREAGADRIRCVAPEFCAEMPEGIERIAAGYRPEYLGGASLVFAATDRPEVNAAVAADARSRGILVNRADSVDDCPGDFSTPAVLRDGELLITVSAGGNPALAAALRDEIERWIDRHWAAMVAAMQALRPHILSSGLPIERRTAMFRDLATPEALNVLTSQGTEGLWHWLRSRHGEK